jgi:hypothetical protein
MDNVTMRAGLEALKDAGPEIRKPLSILFFALRDENRELQEKLGKAEAPVVLQSADVMELKRLRQLQAEKDQAIGKLTDENEHLRQAIAHKDEVIRFQQQRPPKREFNLQRLDEKMLRRISAMDQLSTDRHVRELNQDIVKWLHGMAQHGKSRLMKSWLAKLNMYHIPYLVHMGFLESFLMDFLCGKKPEQHGIRLTPADPEKEPVLS